MAEQSSSVSGGTDTEGTASTAFGWAPHGRALTACVVVFNVAVVLLLYLYFWRMFSRKRVSDESDDDGASSSASSTRPAAASPRARDLVASLPVFVVVHTGAAAAAGEECAVCIAELRDGDEGRALPRCGHRFHAACVDAWLRLHTTCPLCRASVVVAEAEAERSKGGVAETTADVEDMDGLV